MSNITVSCDGYVQDYTVYAGYIDTDSGESLSLVANVSDVPSSGNLPSTSCPFGGLVNELTVRDYNGNLCIEFVSYGSEYYYDDEMLNLSREIADYFEYL